MTIINRRKMKIKKFSAKLYLYLLILSFLTMPFDLIYISAIGDEIFLSDEESIFPICVDEYEQDNPAIYENLIVWEDNRNTKCTDTNSSFKSGDDIFIYNSDTNMESIFSDLPRGESYPNIYKNTIVWSYTNETYEEQILMKTIGGTIKNLSAVQMESEVSPRIDGDYVVWHYSELNNNELSYNLVVHKISTGKTDIRVIDVDFPYGFKISNCKVVWVDATGSNLFSFWKLHIYDILNNRIELEMELSDPDICLSGNTLTYIDSDPFSGYTIKEMDLKTKETKDLVNLKNSLNDLQRYGYILVWSDERNEENDTVYLGNADIYIYDIKNKIEAQITSNNRWQGSPVIYGNIIVWVDERNGNKDLYGYDLTTDTNNNGNPDYLDHGVKISDEDDNGNQTRFSNLLIPFIGIVILIMVIGLVIFLKEKKKINSEIFRTSIQPPSIRMQVQQPPPLQQNCPTCNQPVRFISQYNRFWCDHCHKYI